MSRTKEVVNEKLGQAKERLDEVAGLQPRRTLEIDPAVDFDSRAEAEAGVESVMFGPETVG